MRDACNGTMWVPAGVIRGGVLANIEDSLDEELEIFDVNRAALEGKLKNLTVVQQYALVEMIEDFWNRQTEEPEEPEE